MDAEKLKQEINAIADSHLSKNVFVHIDGQLYEIESIDLTVTDRIDINAVESGYFHSAK